MLSFKPDSRFFAFVNRLVDVFVLNLLWLAFSLPLVTIGAATAAAHAVTLKMVDEEEGYVARGFIRAFRENFRKATVLWLLEAAALYALWIDWQIAVKSPDPPLFALIAGILIAAVTLVVSLYAYPLLARYENSLAGTVRNALRIAFRFPGRTVALLALLGFEVALFSWNVPMLVIGVLVGPLIAIYTVSGAAKGIFRKLEEEGGAGAGGPEAGGA